MNISIRTNLRQAAESFMIAHKLQPNHLPDTVEEVMEHLDIEGRVMDCGERFIKIDQKLTESGFPEVVTWYEESFQIAWYTLPERERKSPEDHMPEIVFDRDFGCALDFAFEISAKKSRMIADEHVQVRRVRVLWQRTQRSNRERLGTIRITSS